ncbi:thioredoxin family protein [Candidatus Woesearchaeota archaeon]|nr:thioredoxin family protein [Candidatus Woesearchaeota archaeon]MBT4935747.1 thioredoxin family protein [Candidatus Woesearchaeota archaeon]MBT5740223.1 thioredoxin family protein [Candidatus Woesearchaeota archaeon]
MRLIPTITALIISTTTNYAQPQEVVEENHPMPIYSSSDFLDDDAPFYAADHALIMVSSDPIDSCTPCMEIYPTFSRLAEESSLSAEKLHFAYVPTENWGLPNFSSLNSRVDGVPQIIHLYRGQEVGQDRITSGGQGAIEPLEQLVEEITTQMVSGTSYIPSL